MDWKEQFDKRFPFWETARERDVKSFISTEIIKKLIEDMTKSIDELREEQPSNIEHPHYYRFLNEWEAREHTLIEAQETIQQLRDKWL